MNPYDAEQMAMLDTPQIARIYAKLMVDDLKAVNKTTRSEFGEPAPDDNELYEDLVKLIKSYLNSDDTI
jgi:hypothetical protein